jgi:hypothetical protein
MERSDGDKMEGSLNDRERRSHPRFVIDLPLEYQKTHDSCLRGGLFYLSGRSQKQQHQGIGGFLFCRKSPLSIIPVNCSSIIYSFTVSNLIKTHFGLSKSEGRGGKMIPPFLSTFQVIILNPQMLIALNSSKCKIQR